MNFPNAVASSQKNHPLSQETENRQLAAENRFLRCRALLRRMPQAATLDEAVEIFGKISGVVAGTLQGLRHEQHFKAQGIAAPGLFSEMFLKQTMTNAVNIFVHLQYLAGALQVQIDESAINQVEHLAQDRRHLHQLAYIGGRHLPRARLHSHRHAHHQVADAFQSVVTFQLVNNWRARASLTLVKSRRGIRSIDVALDHVEFLLALFDSQKCHTRRLNEQIRHIGGTHREQ